ncbi:TSC22 domain family protein 2-like [Xenentodon cancila]
MSKMPAKKKSCFQITSVTQAQVAAVGATDDTESLDDPDESRTEDVSSEIYDMSRAEPVCDRSSSEEALNNAGDAEATANASQASHSSAQLSNPAAGETRKVGASGSSQGGQLPVGVGHTTVLPHVSQSGGMQQQQQQQQPLPANTSQPAALTSTAPPPATSTVTCSSRFRVIKLDHGTGEPFRRGRWTCTEFYERDSEASLAGRTADSIRHGSVTLDPAADRESGLGLPGGSVVSLTTHSGLGSMAEVSQSSTRMHSVETLSQQPQQTLHQNYSATQHGVSGSATRSILSNIKPVVAGLSIEGALQPPAAQNMLPVGQNGLPQSGVHIQKSPIMTPSVQPIPYLPQQQVPVGHHLNSQTEYYQHQQSTSMPPGQSLPLSSLSAVPQPGGPSPVMPPAVGPASVPSQVGDVPGAGGGAVSVGQPAPAVLQQQTIGLGGTGGSVLVGGSALPQQTVSQYAAAGQPQSLGHPTSSGVQNVPAKVVSSSVLTAVPAAVLSASSAAMPNVTTSSLPPGQITHSKAAVALGVQGLPATGFGQMEGGGRKSEGLINAQSPVVSGREPVKPLMPETLQLSTPTVNSLFGIHIPVDGEEDRNPSMAFYKVFQSGSRLRDSKAHSDSASGTNIVAIDNKIEQAMDLVKSHLMYAVREEVEVLKEQIKELYERNSVLERENAVLKSLANSEQLSQLSTQPPASSSVTPPQQGVSQPQLHPQLRLQPKPQQLQPQLDSGQQLQPNVTSA